MRADRVAYLAGITVLSEEGARERWDELQRARARGLKYSDVELKRGHDAGPVAP